MGVSGCGKSTLINTIFGEPVAKIGRGNGSCTSEVTPYEGMFEGISVRLIDTMGFNDTSGILNETIVS